MHASVVGVFCEAGGLAYGFKRERFRLICGVGLDPVCRYPFENNHAHFLREGVTKILAVAHFSRSYKFTPHGEPVRFECICRMIGNAVPVGLSRAIAHLIRKHLHKEGHHA